MFQAPAPLAAPNCNYQVQTWKGFLMTAEPASPSSKSLWLETSSTPVLTYLVILSSNAVSLLTSHLYGGTEFTAYSDLHTKKNFEDGGFIHEVKSSSKKKINLCSLFSST